MTLTPSSLELRSIAENAARTAGAYLKGVFRGDMTIDHKRDRHDLVTEHDRASEEIIVPLLLEGAPGSRIVGEEGGVRGGSGPVTWYIDPIDGTSNFAQGLAFFCVVVAAEVEGEIVAGVVYDPIADRLFAASDEGAFLDGESLVTGPALPAEAATLITGFPTARDLEADGPAALAEFGSLVDTFSSVRRTGSGALSIAHVAAGWTDSALGSSVNPWDVAASMLILLRAGGDYRPLWYDEAPTGGAHLAPGYVALRAGAEYPVLDEVSRAIVARRRG
ncbi:inositol phosphatase [Microbacterium sorbitolivorans]|uniref:inositol-phosphate phosphatase n=1 Tax=Microbacterium sorbitolivorans TaxID=1867410 RepID=A0A367XTP9_9MICO|nr:inositol monophosphatase [Microbacterium sorbitolivorans]RCK56997.1 inositol monophosphatase [Microbacterium sorbitolivorans]GGF47542.1 inositol phosphatase [Microbacterium sorbitolivorans]